MNDIIRGVTNRAFRISKIVGVMEVHHGDHLLLLEGGHVIEIDESDAEALARIVRAMDKVEACDLAEKGDHADDFWENYAKERGNNGAA